MSTTDQSGLRNSGPNDAGTASEVVAAPPGVKSSLRTLEILELLSSGSSGNTVATMARQLSIPKSSLHGILRTMVHRGWLETDETGTQYRLGIRALLLGNAYVESDGLVLLSQAPLDTLAARTGETVHLGRLDGPDVVYLAKRESQHALRLFSAVGRRLPAHATALGKALLAQLPEDEIDVQLNWPLPQLTPKTITGHDELHQELARVRANGYANDDGENATGIQCFSVALAHHPHSLNAISCSIPESRLTPDRVVETLTALRDTASEIDLLAARQRLW